MVYSSTLLSQGGVEEQGIQRIDVALARLLECSTPPTCKPQVLWSMKYRSKGRSIDSGPGHVVSSMSGRVMIFPPPSIDPAFDDSILENVKEVWKHIMGDEVEDLDFLKFEERGVENDDEL